MIKCINDGACQIEAGDYRGAIVSLSTMALNSFKASMEVEHVQQAIEYSFDLDLLMTEGPVDKKERSTTDTDHMTYSRPIHIPERLAHESGFDAQVVFSAVAIFNLALAHHLGGMEDTPSSTNLLKKAAKLYRFGVNIQGQGSYGIIFFLATLNNLGEVHKRLGQFLKSEQHFKQLLSTLMFLTASGEQVSSSELELFFKSTFFLVSPTHVNAAAAA